MSRPRPWTVVTDTSALVSLTVPRADAVYDIDTAPDPLQYLLTSCDVAVPPEVVAELRDVTQYQDIHGVAVVNVLAARTYYMVDDLYKRGDTPESRPTLGFDDGEIDGTVLTNAFNVDGFPTDEFGGTNFALIRVVLQGPCIVLTSRLPYDYVHNDHMTHEKVRTLIETISPHRSWENSPYAAQLLALLE